MRPRHLRALARQRDVIGDDGGIDAAGVDAAQAHRLVNHALRAQCSRPAANELLSEPRHQIGREDRSDDGVGGRSSRAGQRRVDEDQARDSLG